MINRIPKMNIYIYIYIYIYIGLGRERERRREMDLTADYNCKEKIMNLNTEH